ncbi:maleylacetoacetate isomerase [Moraxella lacunata]|uniref:Maleylacetoacetate isomerase n=1 Tax=Moraxella lacunata TaxID=477 RepID=A0A1V4GSJ7_MORLA|nr:maleylacetoacetate isomerase [Moraxella lacunata]OPH35587.1 maleylacetoacetate isomerase [Moraxella lacunata]
MKLYTYFRSSASYRVRIALHLKGLDFESVPIHLVKGEQGGAEYLVKNPQGLVPALDVGGRIITQSLAILDYLENTYPATPLLPHNPLDRANVWAVCQMIACDTHPLNNLKVLKYLQQRLAISDDDKQAWYAHWIHENFAPLEKLLQKTAGNCCFGDTPTLADCVLIPQVYNAKRFGVDLSAYPTITAIDEYCNTLPAFIKAHPSEQVDCIK